MRRLPLQREPLKHAPSKCHHQPIAITSLKIFCSARRPRSWELRYRTPIRHVSSSAHLPALVDEDGLLQLRGPIQSSDGANVPAVDYMKQKSPFAVVLPKALGTEKVRSGPVMSSSHHGKWAALLFDYDRLAAESNMGEPQSSTQRLLDQPDYQTDIGLWNAVFNFCHRKQGRDGALVVWREIFKRKALYQTDGLIAGAFWQSIAETALEDEALLESTRAYAEWMRDWHGTQWPNYYRTVVSSCLESGQLDRALRWHLRLSPHFDPGRKDFFDTLKTFISNPDPALQETLQFIYMTSRHRRLYDTIVPFLWSQGHSRLAQSWRTSLIAHSEKPRSRQSRPFLRFLAGYFQHVPLLPEERSVAGLLPEAESPLDGGSHSGFFLLVNRFYGKAFGIREKNYNDNLGAKWLASTWVSLDTAISVVHDLGIEEIGPRSLQSISLREESAAGIRRRLEQLARLDISTGRSSYAKAIHQLAQADDFDTLQYLLHSDLHPDVFEDAGLQEELLASSSASGDWRTYRLIMAVRLAVSDEAIETAANGLVRTCLEHGRKNVLLTVLDELSAREVEVHPSNTHAISHLILQGLSSPFNANQIQDVDFYVALCRRIARMRFPVAARAWQSILILLGEQGRFDDLESLSLDVVNRHIAWQSSGEVAMKAHVSDVPEVSLSTPHSSYHLLPRDLPLHHERHPVQLIFANKFITMVIRNSFRLMLLSRQSYGATAPAAMDLPRDFDMARGVRLLSMLRDRGVYISDDLVRDTTLACLSKIFGPRDMVRPKHRKAVSRNQLTLAEMKELVDTAWGSELLPAVYELEATWN